MSKGSHKNTRKGTKARKTQSINKRRRPTTKSLKRRPSSKFYTRKNSKASKRKSRSVSRGIGGVIPNSESSPFKELSPNSESSPVNLSPNSESSPFKELSPNSESSPVNLSPESSPFKELSPNSELSPVKELPAPITETAEDEPASSSEDEPADTSEDEPASSSEELEKDRIAPFIKEKQENIWPFFNKPLSERIRTSLDKICPNSGQCVSFGLETEKIRKYFDNYNLSLVDKNAVKRIGGASNNGFVLEVPFVKDNYTAYTVLKSTQDANSDNLFYEALVGLYINKKNYIFPCFLETYGLYQWPYVAARMGAHKGETQQLGRLERKNMSYNAFFDKPEFISDTCLEAELGCVLIQHIHGARTLLNHIRSLKSNMLFFTYHLVQYLYQIYAPLGVLSDEFTHYDLKTDNVLLYTLGKDRDADYHKTAIKAEGVPHNGEYITMNYHYPNRKVVSFNTFDIVKIIDYGRCYFKESEKHNSHNYLKVLRESIIKVAKSDKDLKATHPRRRGECTNRSYGILEDEDPEGSFHYICSNKRNKTHDLRLANEIWTTPEKYKSKNQDENGLRRILAAIFYEDTYQVENGEPDHGYGSEEVLESSYTELETLRKSNPGATMKLEPGSGMSIRNVEDMHLALKDLILHTSHFKEMSKLFESHKKIGEMNIYMDGSKSLQYTAVSENPIPRIGINDTLFF